MARGYPDYEGEKSKLYSAADWAAIEATDKNVQATGTSKAFDEWVRASYTVPSGKTFYLTQIYGCNIASAAADGDSNQQCQIDVGIGVSIPGTSTLTLGGNGGAAIALTKPIVVPGGEGITAQLTNKANHDTDIKVGFGGYEI